MPLPLVANPLVIKYISGWAYKLSLNLFRFLARSRLVIIGGGHFSGVNSRRYTFKWVSIKRPTVQLNLHSFLNSVTVHSPPTLIFYFMFLNLQPTVCLKITDKARFTVKNVT